MFFYVGVLVDMLVGRVQALREDDSRDFGASAIEWAIIAAISVIIATVIGGIVYKVVSDKGTQLQSCANQVSTNCDVNGGN